VIDKTRLSVIEKIIVKLVDYIIAYLLMLLHIFSHNLYTLSFTFLMAQGITMFSLPNLDWLVVLGFRVGFKYGSQLGFGTGTGTRTCVGVWVSLAALF